MISRRKMIQSAAGVGAMAATGNLLLGQEKPKAQGKMNEPSNGQAGIRQSACQWCFKSWDQATFCTNAKKLGLVGIDLVGPDWFDALKKHGLIGTMTPSHGITKGLNRKENWDECLGKIRASIESTSDAGFPNVICFSGNRAGMDDEEGLKNCAEALKQVVGLAEEKKVTICMELLSSKRNHKDYMCDRTAWGAKLVDTVGSDRFKLLYDIYHMQVDEGDVIATLTEFKDRIGHYHTAGVPGRNEIDESQELFYPAIMRAIASTGFKGVVAQEFIPKREPYASLEQAVQICNV